jgi:hypothetical protein
MAMIEVKRPGDRAWVRFSPSTGQAWGEIMKVTCPDGGSPEPVFPGQH